MKYKLLIFLIIAELVLLFFSNNKSSFSDNNNFLLNDKLLNNKIIWSKGYAIKLSIDNNYVLSSTEKKITKEDLDNQKGKNYIWVKMGSTSDIINHNLKLLIDFLNTIDYNVNIITTDGDNSIPDNIDNIIYIL